MGEGAARQRRGQRSPRAPRARPRAPEEGGRAERRCPLCRRGRVPRGGCLRGATVPRSLARDRTSRVAREGNRAGSPRERRRRVSRRRERAWARTVYVVEIAFRGRRRPRRATVRGPPRRARVLGFTTPRRDPRATDRVRTASPGLTRPAPAEPRLRAGTLRVRATENRTAGAERSGRRRVCARSRARVWIGRLVFIARRRQAKSSPFANSTSVARCRDVEVCKFLRFAFLQRVNRRSTNAATRVSIEVRRVNTASPRDRQAGRAVRIDEVWL